MHRISLAVVIGILASPTLWSGGVPPARLQLLTRGINIDNWFSSYSDPKRYATRLTESDFLLIKETGLSVIRLTIAPEVLYNDADPAALRDPIRRVDNAVRMALDAGLSVIVDPIHGTSSHNDFENRLAHEASFRARVEMFWETLAHRYAAYSTERVFFEVMNEPHLSTVEKIDAGWWAPVQERLASAIRRGAPENTIIATGESWGGINGLLSLKPLADANVVYSFHWYEPFTFTHQGAEWTGEIQKQLAGIPYPSSPEAVSAAVGALQDAKARDQVRRYGQERWDAARIRKELSRAANWGAAHGVPVFCGEFGVYKKVSPVEDRQRWISDVRASLEVLHIGWAMWEYDQGFGMADYRDRAHFKGRTVDDRTLEALGLKAVSGMNATAPVPLESFISGQLSKLIMPVEDWGTLWTRDPGMGSLQVEYDDAGAPLAVHLAYRGFRDWALSTGYRIPVRPGEKLRLASRAIVAPAAVPGPSGSVSLEAVAYDEKGAVLDWSYGAVSPATGSAPQPMSTELTIEQGVTAIEPRWSGRGPNEAIMQQIELERE
jgi:aryl-phospho-beta-D-glucosidase BglC (GH1 family)